MSVNHLTSFKTLFQELYPGMVKIALFYIHDLAIAEDITQEIFTRLWERREKLDMIDNLKGYLSNAIKNRCLNYLEHQQVVDKYKQYCLLQEVQDDDEDPEAGAAGCGKQHAGQSLCRENHCGDRKGGTLHPR